MSAGGAGMAMTGAGTLFGAWSSYQAGVEQQKMNEFNAQIAEQQSVDSLNQGETAAVRQGTKGRQVIGEQRASYAGQNVDVNSGTAAAVQTETAAITTEDINAIRVNAARQAWGYKVQAENFRRAGANAYRAGVSNAAGTLLTGGGQVASMGAKSNSIT